MSIFNRDRDQEEEQVEAGDGSEGIAAPVVADPPVEAVEAVEEQQDEIDGWEDPEPAHASTESPEEPPTEEEQLDDDERRPRGWLESDIEKLIKAIQSGEVTIDPVGAPLTPHLLSKTLTNVEGLAKAPSTGAVSAVLDRWVNVGAAETSSRPYAFVDFTPQAKEHGIAGLKQAIKDQRKAEKQAQKDADTEAAKQAAIEAAADAAE